MKKIMANIETGLIEDVIKILGAAIHIQFSHDSVQGVKLTLFNAAKKAVEDQQQPQIEETK